MLDYEANYANNNKQKTSTFYYGANLNADNKQQTLTDFGLKYRSHGADLNAIDQTSTEFCLDYGADGADSNKNSIERLAAILNAVAAIEKAGNMVCPVYVSVVDVHPVGVRLANY